MTRNALSTVRTVAAVAHIRTHVLVQNLVKTERECPYDMREAVCTLIWAANRTEIPELTEVRALVWLVRLHRAHALVRVCMAQVKKQLVKKYGQDFAAAATRNADGCVNERVIQKLSVQVRALDALALFCSCAVAHSVVVSLATERVLGRELHEGDRQAV